MFEAALQVQIFYTFTVIIVLLYNLYVFCSPLRIRLNPQINYIFVIIISLFAIMIIGYREWWAEDFFGDSIRYGYAYLQVSTTEIDQNHDLGYSILMFICRNLNLSVNSFFIVCASLYIVPLLLSVKKLDECNSLVFFIAIITSMSFFPYGVNGIRNGIATSLLLWAYSYNKLTVKTLLIFIIALSFHISTILSLLFWFLSIRFSSERKILMIWFLAIPFSFVLSGSVASLGDIFGGIFKNRVEGYLSNNASLDDFSTIGFRYDFLVYSFIPIFLNSFLFKNVHQTKTYKRIYYTYILTNAFWILINQVPFSNRFAYLSWFLMPIVFIYPLLYGQYFKRPYLIISFSLTLYCILTLIIK